MRPNPIVLLLLVSLSCVSGFAQEAAPDQPVTVEVLEPASLDATADEDLAAILQDNLRSYFGSRGFTVLGPSDDEADLRVETLYSLEGRTVSYMVKVYDVAGSRFASGTLGQGRNTINIHEDLLDAFETMDSDMERERSFIAARKAGSKNNSGLGFATLTFTSPQNGTAVDLVGAGPLGTIENNVLASPVTPLALGQEIEVSYSLAGYYPRTVRFAVNTGRETIALAPMFPKTRISLLASYHAYQMLGGGGGFRFYLVQDQLFVQAEDQFSVQTDAYPGADPVYHNDFFSLFGSYLYFSPESPFRVSISAGLGVYQTILPSLDQPLRLDPYIVLMSLAPEYNTRRFAIGFRWDLRYAINLLGFIPGVDPLLPQRPFYAFSPSTLFLEWKL